MVKYDDDKKEKKKDGDDDDDDGDDDDVKGKEKKEYCKMNMTCSNCGLYLFVLTRRRGLVKIRTSKLAQLSPSSSSSTPPSPNSYTCGSIIMENKSLFAHFGGIS